MPYATKHYEELFSRIFDGTDKEQLEVLSSKDILKYRVKTIKSGEMLECEIYPLWKTSKGGLRAEKEAGSREAQKNLNDKNTKKRVIRLVNANFTNNDIWATFTYDNEHLPETEAEAQKNIQNYIRRLQAYIKKNGLPELKYIYVTEYSEDEKKGKKRVHHHIIMNFGDRDTAEKIWNKGGRTHSRRLQPDDYGLEGLARYITKDKNTSKGDNGTDSPKTSKRYATSLNLYKPWEHATISDTKMTKRRAMGIALDQNTAGGIFEKMYKGYSFKDIDIKYSDFVSGVYLYVRMRKRYNVAKRG